MSWAEVYKINENTKNVVEDNMCLVASDTNVYAVFPDSVTYNSGITTRNSLCTFTLPHSGSFALKYSLGRSSSTTTEEYYVEFKITRNGTTVFSTKTGSMIDGNDIRKVTLSGTKGDVFKLSIVEPQGKSFAWLYLYGIYATPLPAKSLTITVP